MYTKWINAKNCLTLVGLFNPKPARQNMLKLDNHASGRHFLHIPGPSPVPSRVLRAISYQTIDHRGPEFGAFGLKVLEGIKKIFKDITGITAKEEKAAIRANKKADRIAKLQAKIDALTNPVGTKARKAAKKPGAVKVYNPEEIAEANAIAAKIQAKKA